MITSHLKNLSKVMLVWLAVSALTYLLIPEYRVYVAGLMIGSVVSFINSYYLAFKVKHFSESIVHRRGKRLNLGFLTRASISVLAVMWALVSPQIHIGTTIAGLLFAPVCLVLIGFLSTFRSRTK